VHDHVPVAIVHTRALDAASPAELVLDHGDPLAVLVGEDVVQHGCLAGHEEPGEDCDGHLVHVGHDATLHDWRIILSIGGVSGRAPRITVIE
jgi:hypothetical protein